MAIKDALYVTNLATVIYNFYGGKVSEIAYLETVDDRYHDREGNMQRKREHYPDHPKVSVESCRSLAEYLIEHGQYERLMTLFQRAPLSETMREELNTVLMDTAQQLGNNLEFLLLQEQQRTNGSHGNTRYVA